MTYGIIDVGSNTIRLCIYKVEENRIIRLFNNKTTAGLIGYVNDGEMSQKGIRKACSVLKTYKEMAAQANIEALYVFATASLRNISNGKEAVAFIERETGLSIDVLSGYDEARLDFIGAAHARELKDGIMVDIGGGSTKILIFENGAIKKAVSLECGSLYLFRNYVSGLFPKSKERKAMRSKVRDELKKAGFSKKMELDNMVGIGGTIRAVGKFDIDILERSDNEHVISVDDIKLLMNELKDEERRTLRKILRVCPDRVHTLIPGLMILSVICKYFGCKTIDISDYGVREGYLYKKVVEGK